MLLGFSTTINLPHTTIKPQPSICGVSKKKLRTTMRRRRPHLDRHHAASTRGLSMTVTETARDTAPIRVRNANVAIVGGGPSGLFAAIALAERGIPVTVFERNDVNVFSAPRSYLLGVLVHGRNALQTVPGLFEHIAEGGLTWTGLQALRLQVDGSIVQVPFMARPSGNFVPNNVLITRTGLAMQLRSFAERYDCIKIVDQAVVNDIRFCGDGDVELEWQVDESVQTMRTKLLLACDGKNSVVQQALLKADVAVRNSLRSANGLSSRSVNSPSTGLLVKSFVIDERQINKWYERHEGPLDEIANERRHLRIMGQRKGRAFRELFDASMFPQSSLERQRVGGYLATVVRPSNHDVWKLNDVEEAYRLFEANFPQMPVRECITRSDMQSFIEARPLRFPPVSRSNSLVVHVDGEKVEDVRPESAGIIFLGDAAHCFPPDAGQGVNAAFQDVQVLMRILDAADDDCSIESMLKSYESEREEDVEGLLCVARFSSPYRYGQSRVGSFGAMLNVALRKKLSKLFPGVIHPPIGVLLVQGLSYKEIGHLVNSTTTRLYAASASLCVAALGLMALAYFR